MPITLTLSNTWPTSGRGEERLALACTLAEEWSRVLMQPDLAEYAKWCMKGMHSHKYVCLSYP